MGKLMIMSELSHSTALHCTCSALHWALTSLSFNHIYDFDSWYHSLCICVAGISQVLRITLCSILMECRHISLNQWVMNIYKSPNVSIKRNQSPAHLEKKSTWISFSGVSVFWTRMMYILEYPLWCCRIFTERSFW